MSHVYRITVEVTAPLQPTEERARVVDAITNVFPEAEIELTDEVVVATTHVLDRFSELIHRQEILDTARSELFDGAYDDRIEFRLKKQAAFMDRVNFAVGSPNELGEIDVRITLEEPDIESFIDMIAPPTVDGRPVDEQ